MSGWAQAVEENREEIIGKWLAGQSISELALFYCLREATLERLIRQAFQQTVRLVADQARAQHLTTAPSPSDTPT